MHATLTGPEQARDRTRLIDLRYGGRLIRVRTSDSRSDLFGRCPNCGGLQIRGICQRCGFTSVCCDCGRVKHANGDYRHVPRNPSPRESHGLCPPCYRRTIDQFFPLRHTTNPATATMAS